MEQYYIILVLSVPRESDLFSRFQILPQNHAVPNNISKVCGYLISVRVMDSNISLCAVDACVEIPMFSKAT